MERLIIKYTFGYSCEILSEVTEITQPFVYESKQKAINDLTEQMIKIDDDLKKHYQLEKKWNEKLNSISKNNVDKWQKCYEERPKEPNTVIFLGKVKINFKNLIENNENQIQEPEIITLDEWYKDA